LLPKPTDIALSHYEAHYPEPAFGELLKEVTMIIQEPRESNPFATIKLGFTNTTQASRSLPTASSALPPMQVLNPNELHAVVGGPVIKNDSTT
jgi:hypothetical protein